MSETATMADLESALARARDGMLKAETVVLRVNSHRAGKKLADALGRRPQYSYTWEQGGRFVVLTTCEANSVLPITGITRSRMKPDQVSPCWSSL